VTEKKYKTFKEFYPFYLNEHRNSTCRLLHVIGTSLLLLVLFFSLYTSQYKLLIALPFIGYGFAWIGHFVFEKNRPATFTYPLYSFIGDWVMWWQVITLKIKI
jgi:hypothetical protein